MELEQVAFDIEAIEKCHDQVSDLEVKRLIDKYNANIEQILGSLAVPLLLMTHGLKSVKYFQYWLQGAIETKNVGKEKTKKGKEEIDKFIATKFEEEKEIHVDDAKREIEKLRKQAPFFEQAIRNNALNTLVNTWTIFEASIKDLWIYSLNSHPKKLLFNVLKGRTSDVEGITGKNVSLALLAKYDFDISRNLGEILASKFDFTTVAGIRKSYKELFNLTSQELKIFDNRNLVQLEITRHLVVHNAGIIDSDYHKRTHREGEKLGKRVRLTTSQLSRYCNSSIYTIISLFKMSDKVITAEKE